MSLKALIFDVDGTISNTEKHGHLVAFNKSFQFSGLDWNWSSDLYRELLEVTGGKLRIKHYVENYLDHFDVDDLDKFALELHQLKTNFYVELMNEGKIPLRTGVERLFTEARENGIQLAIATTTSLVNVEALITNTLGSDALSWFSIIGAGDMVKNLKPAPDVFEYVLDQLKLSPKECIVFEDSLNGHVASRKAGLNTVITVNEYTSHQKFDDAMIVLNHLGEAEKPFSVIHGDNFGHSHVSIDFLKKLYERFY